MYRLYIYIVYIYIYIVYIYIYIYIYNLVKFMCFKNMVEGETIPVHTPFDMLERC